MFLFTTMSNKPRKIKYTTGAELGTRTVLDWTNSSTDVDESLKQILLSNFHRTEYVSFTLYPQSGVLTVSSETKSLDLKLPKPKYSPQYLNLISTNKDLESITYGLLKKILPNWASITKETRDALSNFPCSDDESVFLIYHPDYELLEIRVGNYAYYVQEPTFEQL